MLTASSYATFYQGLAENQSALRAICVTEAAISVDKCFFNLPGGPKPSAGFGCAAPLDMADLEATAEATSVEETLMGVVPVRLLRAVKRQIDAAIIGALDGCDATPLTLTMDHNKSPLDIVARGMVTLGDQDVPIDDEDKMFAVAAPILRDYLLQVPEFVRGDYIEVHGGGRKCRHFRALGFNWLFHPVVSGAYMLHRHALGHALDLAGLAVPGAVTGGIDAKTGLGWMKAKTRHIAAVLQPTGIVRLVMDGSKPAS